MNWWHRPSYFDLPKTQNNEEEVTKKRKRDKQWRIAQRTEQRATRAMCKRRP